MGYRHNIYNALNVNKTYFKVKTLQGIKDAAGNLIRVACNSRNI